MGIFYFSYVSLSEEVIIMTTRNRRVDSSRYHKRKEYAWILTPMSILANILAISWKIVKVVGSALLIIIYDPFRYRSY